jgi:hypothetical protein
VINMARGRPLFKQTDVARFLKAARAAGVKPERVEIAPDGTIALIPAREEAAPTTPDRNEWDDVIDPH